MGRDTYLYVFVGRKCTEEEVEKILEVGAVDPDYADLAQISELDTTNPFYKIDGYPVVLIFTHNDQSWFVCEKLIGTYDIEYQKEPIELDFTNIQIENDKHKLLMVSEISF